MRVLTLDRPKTHIYGLHYLIAGMDIIPTIRTRMGHSPSMPMTITKVDEPPLEEVERQRVRRLVWEEC